MRRKPLAISLAVVIPGVAHADAIIPYMAVPFGNVLLLPLVIVIEALVLRRFLGGPFRQVLLQSFIANLASTAVGAGLYCVTSPLFDERVFQWWIRDGLLDHGLRSAVLAFLVAVVLWASSWAIESQVVGRLRRQPIWGAVSRACAAANAVTYALLVMLALTVS